MLESEIQKLTDHVAKLTIAVEAQTALFARFEQLSKDAGRKSLTESAAKWEAEGLTVPDNIKIQILDDDSAPKSKPKAAKAPPVAEAEIPDDTAAISRDDVQNKCMTIVRADRTKRKVIEALITEFGGTLIRDVPEDRLVELSAKLDELV